MRPQPYAKFYDWVQLAIAAEALEMFKLHFPDERQAYSLLGEIRYTQAWYKLAAHCHEQALSLDPTSGEKLVMLGDIYFRQGHFERAIQAVRRTLMKQPDHPHASYLLDCCTELFERESACQRQQEDLLTLDERVERAKCLIHQGLLNTAIRSLISASQSDPTNLPLLQLLGLAFQEQGQMENAAKAFRQALALGDDSFDTHYRWGHCSFLLGDYESAKTAFAKALWYKPEAWITRFQFGNSLEMLGELDAAEIAYQQAQQGLKNESKVIEVRLAQLERRMANSGQSHKGPEQMLMSPG